MRGRGRFYQGRVNTTTEGILCQRWDSRHPHQHDLPVPLFPELAGAENYCRNAGGQEPRPWCFTTDPAVRWQYCDVPRCGEWPSGFFVLKFLRLLVSSSLAFSFFFLSFLFLTLQYYCRVF